MFQLLSVSGGNAGQAGFTSGSNSVGFATPPPRSLTPSIRAGGGDPMGEGGPMESEREGCLSEGECQGSTASAKPVIR